MKHIFPLIMGFFLLTMISCAEKGDNAAQKKALVDRWLQLWNSGDMQLAEGLFSDQFVAHIPNFPNVSGLESYTQEVIRTGTDITDFQAILEDIVVEGDHAAGRFTATGTVQGELMGMPVDTAGYTNTWIVLFHFIEDSIREEWWEFDMLGVMQQLGVIPFTEEGPPALQRTDPEDFVWSPPSPVTGDPGNPDINKALVMREFDAWNQKDVVVLMNVLDEVYADEFVYHDPARPHVTGLAGYKNWAASECLDPFPDLVLNVVEIFAEEDKVVARWTFTGTHAALGKEITQTGNSIYRIADGRIVEGWCAFDMLGTINQMQDTSEQ
jgi:predicted ester cyclase